mmetsp:Transcript_22398/g.45014  ORF Transcript_22398/g.45014 Transcript_22398/m.45014 type:complete len:228 (-) Transcript_22398:708-1391(-)
MHAWRAADTLTPARRHAHRGRHAVCWLVWQSQRAPPHRHRVSRALCTLEGTALLLSVYSVLSGLRLLLEVRHALCGGLLVRCPRWRPRGQHVHHQGGGGDGQVCSDERRVGPMCGSCVYVQSLLHGVSLPLRHRLAHARVRLALSPRRRPAHLRGLIHDHRLRGLHDPLRVDLRQSRHVRDGGPARPPARPLRLRHRPHPHWLVRSAKWRASERERAAADEQQQPCC